MKKSFLFLSLAALVLTLALSSCKSDKKSYKELEEIYLPKPQMSLDQTDSTEVWQLANTFLDCLREERFDDAMGMLYFLDHDSIVALPAKQAKEQRRLLEQYKGVRYEVERLSFREEKDNILKYNVILFEREGEKDYRPNTIGFVLKPIRRDGKWYLTMADSRTDTNHMRGTRIEL